MFSLSPQVLRESTKKLVCCSVPGGEFGDTVAYVVYRGLPDIHVEIVSIDTSHHKMNAVDDHRNRFLNAIISKSFNEFDAFHASLLAITIEKSGQFGYRYPVHKLEKNKSFWTIFEEQEALGEQAISDLLEEIGWGTP